MTPHEMRNARFALGMTQKEFAAALRVGSEAVIRSWESGRRPISGPAAVAIELMLKQHLAPIEAFGGDGTAPSAKPTKAG